MKIVDGVDLAGLVVANARAQALIRSMSSAGTKLVGSGIQRINHGLDFGEWFAAKKRIVGVLSVPLLAVEPANIPEVRSIEEAPIAYCRRLAHEKASVSTRKSVGYWQRIRLWLTVQRS